MAAWGYGLLGPVEVRVDGRAVPLPGARQRLVLAMLLVDANRVVPADRLVDELWEAALPADPRGALRTQVSRLRRALGPAGGDLATAEGGYRLTVRRSQLDVARFEDMLAEADEASGKQALRLLDEALALWRGPAVGEFARIVLRQQERMRLEAARSDRERPDRAGNRNAQRQCDSRSAYQNESLLRLSRPKVVHRDCAGKMPRPPNCRCACARAERIAANCQKILTEPRIAAPACPSNRNSRWLWCRRARKRR